MKVGVLAPESSWHFRDLQRAAVDRDDVKLISVDFSSLATLVGVQSQSFFDREDAIDSLDALVVRTMPHGSLQQVVFRMDLLHRINAQGVRVVNSPRSVEIAIDKYLSLSLMSESGIHVPPFAVCQTVEQGLDFFEILGQDVILKPIFGSMGKHVQRFRERGPLRTSFESFVDRGEVIYLQKFIEHGGTDIRILVCENQCVAMRRCASDGHWLTNIARGGTAKPHEPTNSEIDIAIAAARVNRCEVAGVDLVYSKGSDEPLVLEVNAAPGWEAIQRISNTDVASRVLNVVLEKCS